MIVKEDTAFVLTIDQDALNKYSEHYFSLHLRAQKNPITQPYHESINTWMIMKRPMMNALKQRWKDFIEWMVYESGFSDVHLKECEITQTIYYATNHRHDIDNTVPKFILDGLVSGGLIEDDDSKHIHRLTLECYVDKENPRTEMIINF